MGELTSNIPHGAKSAGTARTFSFLSQEEEGGVGSSAQSNLGKVARAERKPTQQATYSSGARSLFGERLHRWHWATQAGSV